MGHDLDMMMDGPLEYQKDFLMDTLMGAEKVQDSVVPMD